MRRSGAPTERLCWAWTLSFGQRPHIFRDGLAPTVVIAGAPIWEKARARLRLRRISMSDQRGFVSADEFHPDPYTQASLLALLCAIAFVLPSNGISTNFCPKYTPAVATLNPMSFNVRWNRFGGLPRTGTRYAAPSRQSKVRSG